jgi:hypothetical protein
MTATLQHLASPFTLVTADTPAGAPQLTSDEADDITAEEFVEFIDLQGSRLTPAGAEKASTRSPSSNGPRRWRHSSQRS